MAENRFFLPVDFVPNAEHLLTGEEHHHLSKVMRNEKGDIVELVNGKNQLALATILEVGKQTTTLRLTSLTQASPPPPLILAQGLARPKNLDLIIEKGTELGATAFYLFPAERSEKEELSENQTTRLHTLMISALKQCGRLDLPSLEFKPPLAAWKAPKMRLLFGDLDPVAPPLTASAEATLIFIGPEKGFSPKEIEHLHRLGAQGVRLNPNILRAETAALCALSVLALRNC